MSLANLRKFTAFIAIKLVLTATVSNYAFFIGKESRFVLIGKIRT